MSTKRKATPSPSKRARKTRSSRLTSFFKPEPAPAPAPAAAAEEEVEGTVLATSGEETTGRKKFKAQKRAPPTEETGTKEPEEATAAKEPEEEDVDDGDEMITVGGVTIHKSWSTLKPQFQQPYFKALQRFVAKERKGHKVFPPEDQVYSAFNLTPRSKVKVVVLGQDPYHGDGQAHGLAFSVRKGVKIPPSLRNMIKEAVSDVGISKPDHGFLDCWARQGVFMLNTVLTVQAHKANSHRKQGWEKFTDAVIQDLNRMDNLVFMLWGKPAQKKGKHLDRNRHLVLECVHPSPLSASRGWFGSKHFSQANAYLKKHGKTEIDWNIVD